MEPILAPLPGITGDRKEPVAVGREGVDGSRGGKAIFAEVDFGELPLPDVAQMAATGGEFVAPRILLLHEAAAGGVLPFGFPREAFAGPFTVGLRIVPGDVDDGVVVALVEEGSLSVR